MAEKIMTPEEYYKKVSKDDKDAILDFSKRKKIDFIPTGSWVINSLIGDGTLTGKPGGLPRGHIVEAFGDESSGKSTFALSACKQVQEMGGLPVYLDFEQTFHPIYAERIGLNLDKNKFMVLQPRDFQQGARIIFDTLRMKPHLIVVDSVSAMIPKQVMEGDIDEGGRIGLQAQLMSGMLSYISKFLSDSNACLLFLNQLRTVIKKNKYDTGPDEESSGGWALKFYSSVRLKFKKSTVEKVEVKSKTTGKLDKEPINVMIKATVVKNKIDKPYYSSPVYIRFGEGYDNILSIIELATNTGVIKKSGAFLTFEQGEHVLAKAQGREQLWKLLHDDHKLFGKLRESLVLKQDEQAKDDYSKFNEVVENGGVDKIDSVLDNIATNFIEKETVKKARKKETSD